jgi:hypothetical protein
MNKKEILNLPLLKNYNVKFRENLLNSLYKGGILNYVNELFILSDNIDMKTNYIEIFFTTTEYISIWELKRENELANCKEDIVSSLVNHIVKKTTINFNELLVKINESMKLFVVNTIMLEKVVKTMIDKDYIKYEGDRLVKLVY